MRILILTHSFNSLSQRIYSELVCQGHEVSVELDIQDTVTAEAVSLFRPDVILAPYLKTRIPASLWTRHLCLVVHPGIPGDRGPSALDWAILEGKSEWGVTVFQANGELDGGDVWAFSGFPMRLAPKGSLYRNEVTEAAVRAVMAALERCSEPAFRPDPQSALDPAICGRAHPLMTQSDRAIDWDHDRTETVLRKIYCADGAPGVCDTFYGKTVFLYGAHPEERLCGEPGALIAQRLGAVCRATTDGAVWITHMREKEAERRGLKLPAASVLGAMMSSVPEVPIGGARQMTSSWQEIGYERRGAVGFLSFDFYNGAMSTDQCRALLDAYRHARDSDVRVLVLMGGRDFWSNGINLNVIEAALSPADESWQNIHAMNDLVLEILSTDRQLTMAAMSGNAGAGGVFLALAADAVYARSGVILNPHYKNMGNLYGSEYWTYLLPRRMDLESCSRIMDHRLPLVAREACDLGLIDGEWGPTVAEFRQEIARRAAHWAEDVEWSTRIAHKASNRQKDEARRPLAAYRASELERMWLNFYGFDPSYHVARYNFVYKVPHSRTPLYLARHRRLKWLAPPVLNATGCYP
ncbi:MAG: hydrogenase maturation protein [Acidiferrobacter sp.]